MVAYENCMQAQGARVVPIITEEVIEVTQDKIRQLDRVLYPAGWETTTTKVNMSLTLSNKPMIGHFYQDWGTCLGMSI